MKNIKLMVVYGLMLSGIIQASDSEIEHDKFLDSQIGWTYNYDQVNFAHPSSKNDLEDTDPRDKLAPSEVGFYNGDMQEYLQKLEQEYPKDSCLQTRTIGGSWLHSEGSKKELQTEDCSFNERYEHIRQDAVMHAIISMQFGEHNDLLAERATAIKSRDFYQTIACCGLNQFDKRVNFPSLSPELLADKVSYLRAKKYVQLKKGYPEFSGKFLERRNELVVLVNSKNLPDNGLELTEGILDAAYTGMREKVLLHHQTTSLNREKYCYQAIITTAFAAASVGTYLWANKK